MLTADNILYDLNSWKGAIDFINKEVNEATEKLTKAMVEHDASLKTVRSHLTELIAGFTMVMEALKRKDTD
jgi:hypothetical protein